MSVIVLLLAAGGVVAGGFLCAFLWAVRTGQFDDTATPAIRLLLDDRHHARRPELEPRSLAKARSAPHTR
jgi:cbb3-type cytochrome oxidase maturation protein